MFIHNPFLSAGSSLFVSVNSTNQYVATASIDGNISIRSVENISMIYNKDQISDINSKESERKGVNNSNVTTTNNNENNGNNNLPSKYTKPLCEVEETPDLDPLRIANAEKVLNKVGVRSRSKITSLRYANLLSNSNLLAAVYKNGEVYIVTNPQDVNKCRIQQIFKHVNGLLLDFSWSADDQLMAFTSMNNEIIIYDVIYGKIISNLHLHENIEVLNSKDGTTEEISIPVKGVTFDKCANDFLITLGDDKVLNVIKYRLVRDEYLGRKLEYKIVREFDNIINSAKLNKATIKKISISPDDKLISCPNTSKSRIMRIALVSKEQKSDNVEDPNNWRISKELVANGYKSFMTIFSPCVYQNDKNETFYVLASLSTDSVLTIWRTDIDTPVYAITNIAPPILDFCWSMNGLMIFLTPQNGSMLVAVFRENEFGKKLYSNNELTIDLQNKTRELLPLEFEKMTKWRSFMNDHPQLVKEKEEAVFNAELKKVKIRTLEERTSENRTTSPDIIDRKNEIPKTSQANTDKENNIIKKSENVKQNLKPKGNKESKENKVVSKDVKENGNKSIRKENEIDVGKEEEKDLNKDSGKPKEKKQKVEEVKSNKEKTKDNSSNPQRSNGNKERENTKEIKSNGNTPQKNKKDNSLKLVEKSKKRPLSTSNYDLPSNSVPKDLNSKVVKMMKKDSSQFANGSNYGSTSTANSKKKREIEPVEFIGSVIINPQISFSNIRIAIPKLRTNISYRLPDDKTLHLVVKNGNGFESQPTRISLSKEISKLDIKQIFVDFLPHKIHIVCGSEIFWALSTSTGQVFTYTESGRRVLPALVLGSPLSFLEMKDNFLLAVTCTGDLYVWDLKKKKSLFKPISLYPLLQPIYSLGQASSTNQITSAGGSDNIDNNFNANINVEANNLVFVNGELLTRSENLTMCSITSQGIPIVTLSNGNGYLFNKDMNTWSLISDSWWAFGSQYWDSSMSTDNLKSVGLLEYMESHTNDEINRRGKAKFFSKISKLMLMREGYENLETIISLNHLENKINFYLYLKDYNNYKTFLIIYAKRLSELNLKSRLLEILQYFFADKHGEICGHSKKEILEELILSCSKNREVQHILVQYSESLGLLPLADDSDIDVL